MKYRISKLKCSNLDGSWVTYVPEYKHWYNLFWQRWSDPLTGFIDCFDDIKDAEQFIHTQKSKKTFTTKVLDTIEV